MENFFKHESSEEVNFYPPEEIKYNIQKFQCRKVAHICKIIWQRQNLVLLLFSTVPLPDFHLHYGWTWQFISIKASGLSRKGMPCVTLSAVNTLFGPYAFGFKMSNADFRSWLLLIIGSSFTYLGFLLDSRNMALQH